MNTIIRRKEDLTEAETVLLLLRFSMIGLSWSTLYKYHILYGVTLKMITPRKHCQPRQSRQCLPRGDNLPCHPVKNVIFILLYLQQISPPWDIAVWHSKLSSGQLTIRLLEINMRYNNKGFAVSHGQAFQYVTYRSRSCATLASVLNELAELVHIQGYVVSDGQALQHVTYHSRSCTTLALVLNDLAELVDIQGYVMSHGQAFQHVTYRNRSCATPASVLNDLTELVDIQGYVVSDGQALWHFTYRSRNCATLSPVLNDFAELVDIQGTLWAMARLSSMSLTTAEVVLPLLRFSMIWLSWSTFRGMLWAMARLSSMSLGILCPWYPSRREINSRSITTQKMKIVITQWVTVRTGMRFSVKNKQYFSHKLCQKAYVFIISKHAFSLLSVSSEKNAMCIISKVLH